MFVESPEERAKLLAEEYSATLFSKGEVFIDYPHATHTWQGVIDENLDHILVLQRALHPDPLLDWEESAVHFGEAAVALRKAQEAVVKDWAKRTAEEVVGL